MPHGGYHGTVVMGGNIIQQGQQDNQGNYEIQGGIDDESRLDFNPPSGNQNNENINQQVEDKKKEIEALKLAQEGIFGANVDPDEDYLLLMGDPSAIGIACAIAATQNRGKFKCLKWDRREYKYYPIEVNLFERGEIDE